MAKTETQTAATEASIAPPAVDAGGKGDSRSIMLTVPLSDGSSKQMSRTAYIKTRAAAVPQPDRGTIRKEVSALQGEDVPYQVIFAATKGLYPEKSKKGAAASTASGEGAAE